MNLSQLLFTIWSNLPHLVTVTNHIFPYLPYLASKRTYYKTHIFPNISRIMDFHSKHLPVFCLLHKWKKLELRKWKMRNCYQAIPTSGLSNNIFVAYWNNLLKWNSASDIEIPRSKMNKNKTFFVYKPSNKIL